MTARAQSLRMSAGWSRRCCESRSPAMVPAPQPPHGPSTVTAGTDSSPPAAARAGSGQGRHRELQARAARGG